MIEEPNCSKRLCKNFLPPVEAPPDKNGVVVSSKFKFHCKAFRKREIPKEILYGKNLHLKPFKGDNGIQFEKAKPEEDSSSKDKELYDKQLKMFQKDNPKISIILDTTTEDSDWLKPRSRRKKEHKDIKHDKTK